jgi:hypothetical protein
MKLKKVVAKIYPVNKDCAILAITLKMKITSFYIAVFIINLEIYYLILLEITALTLKFELSVSFESLSLVFKV